MKNNPIAPRILRDGAEGESAVVLVRKSPLEVLLLHFYYRIKRQGEENLSDISSLAFSPLLVNGLVCPPHFMSLCTATVLRPLPCIVFSAFWNGSIKGVSTSCCLSPHLFSVPVKLGNILFMFPFLPHCCFSEACTFTLLRPCFSRKQGVGTNKKEGRKKSITPYFVPECLSLFSPSLSSLQIH